MTRGYDWTDTETEWGMKWGAWYFVLTKDFLPTVQSGAVRGSGLGAPSGKLKVRSVPRTTPFASGDRLTFAPDGEAGGIVSARLNGEPFDPLQQLDLAGLPTGLNTVTGDVPWSEGRTARIQLAFDVEPEVSVRFVEAISGMPLINKDGQNGRGLAFEVINNSDSETIVLIGIDEIPPGWTAVIAGSPVMRLAPRSRRKRTLSVEIMRAPKKTRDPFPFAISARRVPIEGERSIPEAGRATAYVVVEPEPTKNPTVVG